MNTPSATNGRSDARLARMSAEARVDALRNTLERARDQQLVILLSGHPDPDAIGAALAHKRICERVDISTTIAHILPVSRSENRALVKLLDVPLVRVSETSDLERFQFVSLVDCSSSESTIRLPDGIELLTIVDHHRPAQTPEAPFVDIRHDVGATCTIYADYLSQGVAPLESNDASATAVATAMFFGIQTDTDDFALATSADFLAAAYLKPHTDAESLSRLGRRSLTAESMDAVSRALADLEVIRDFAIAGVGRVSALNRDAIATAADFILRREDIDTVVVFGIVDDRIDGSLRTNRASVDPAVFMSTAFGEDEQGRPYGGGRNDKGGFQIPLGLLSECEDDAALWALAHQVIRGRIARVVPEVAKISKARTEVNSK